jgi:hypothetical protein
MSEQNEQGQNISERFFSRMASSANLIKNTLDFSGSGNGQASFDARIKKMTDQLSDQIPGADDSDDKGKGVLELLRSGILYYRDRTLIGQLYIQLMLLINVLSCFQYIYLTYTTIDTNTSADLYYAFFYLELVVACLFVFDFILSLFSADNFLLFFTTFQCWVDIMTFIPVFTTYNIACPDFYHIGSAKACVYFVLCGMTTTRILRSLRFQKYFLAIEDEVQRYLADMGLKIVVMILFSKTTYTVFR